MNTDSINRPVVYDAGHSSQKEFSFGFVQRKVINIMSMAAGDACALILSLLLAGTIRWYLKGDTMVPTWLGLITVAWWLGSYAMNLLPGWGLGAAEELRRQVTLLVAIFGITTAAIFLSKVGSEASRLTLTIGFVIGVFLVPLARLQVKRILLHLNLWGLPTVIYGGEKTIPFLVDAMRSEPGLGYYPVGVFTDDLKEGEQIAQLPVMGPVSKTERNIPMAFIALPGMSRHDLITMLDGPLANYRHTVLIPDLFEAPSLWVQPRDIQGILGLEITSNLLNPLSRFLKRSVEMLLVVSTIWLWLPLCVILGLLIRLVEGKAALFRQERVGQGGRAFKTYKFRTMHPEAEKLLEQKLQQDPALRAEWEENFKLRKDPRITAIGRFLRITSMDELPQLINVLKGEMSLVGPRPLPTYHYYGLAERVRILRDRVRPGMTGLWQVSGRSESGIEGMERWDTYYVRNWSIWLDIVILFRTTRAVLHQDGAY